MGFHPTPATSLHLLAPLVPILVRDEGLWALSPQHSPVLSSPPASHSASG